MTYLKIRYVMKDERVYVNMFAGEKRLSSVSSRLGTLCMSLKEWDEFRRIFEQDSKIEVVFVNDTKQTEQANGN